MNNPHTERTRILNESNISVVSDLGVWVFAAVFAMGIVLGFGASSFLLFFVMLVIGMISLFVLQTRYYDRHVKEFKKLCNYHNMLFRKDLSSSTSDPFLFLGHSEEVATLLIRHPVSENQVRDVFVNLNDVLNIELSIDHPPVYQAAPIATFSGAAIGGIAFGVAGAVVGAIAMSQVGKGKIGNITLKLRIEDLETSLIQIDFIYKPMRPSRAIVPLTLAENWINLMEAMRYRITKPAHD